MESWRHEPADYPCPFCRFVAREFDDLNAESDVVAETDLALARISPKWWPHNPGGVLVMPREHHENLYDLPAPVGHAVWDLVQQAAVAMRASYGCDGVSTRQHNEPHGGQDVWHLHVHVLPRHRGDRLYENDASSRWATTDERATYAALLRAGWPRA
ncbi:HIT family protein [Nocardioides sp. zg-1308]|uniref:HIT family protein n=1 Tax=Nocardioides TaxID=1839 RepID=UPI0015576F32|nr:MULTISPECIES: HIT family protein [unclassified Nocardioides]NPD05920.1 HIT family protein [Nocardioides sp. zg-1308]WQQ23792.1 HIT family protein [Nocardioides sp. S-34]